MMRYTLLNDELALLTIQGEQLLVNIDELFALAWRIKQGLEIS